MRKWLPLLILASAQFVMVLDSSVMNVAISQIVEDLDTTIQGVLTAITLYTLVMAHAADDQRRGGWLDSGRRRVRRRWEADQHGRG